MPTPPHAMHLGDAELGRLRHVCGLFEGPEEADRVLLPFILEGLVRGERVIHLVEDPKANLERLASRTDVSAAVASGQLDVRRWDETYLSNGAFSGARMLAYIRRTLRESAWLDFSATRVIGDMAWARAGVPGVDGLAAYESAIEAIVTRPRTMVVCAYDVGRHSASTIAAILSAHQAALVGGRLQESPRTGRAPTPRERILMAAAMLFAENGTGPTGVDTLIEAAGVAKATFYRHFPSKDALIVAWLQDPRTRWFDRVRTRAEARASTPIDVIPSLFEAVAEWLEADDYLGCPYLNTAVEISDPRHPASQTIRTYLAEIGAYLEEGAAAAGHPNPAELGSELHALLAGSISLAVANRTSGHALAARDAAIQLIEGKRGGGGRTRAQ
jgi:AcrR family transcriptional regulator